MPKFIPGLELSRKYFQQAIKPILDREFSRLKYSAAVIGWGSEVLGFDTEISSDHHWGPRALLFLSENDYPKFEARISKTLADNLPYEFLGYSTSFGQGDAGGVRLPVKITSGPVDHMIQLFTIRDFFKARLRFDPANKITVQDWLTFPQQRLLELVKGEVYHDDGAKLARVRQKFSYYPHEVWLYLLSAQWRKISQEEAFVGRTGDVGDELGSQLIAARIVRELMKLAFLMEREYIPYSKWFGSAFSRLKIAKKLSPLLRQVLLSESWKQREMPLSEAYSIIARQHNSLQLTAPLPTQTSSYFSRPYQVIHAVHFADAIRRQIKDRALKKIETEIGSVDQFTDSTDLVCNPDLCRKLKIVYES